MNIPLLSKETITPEQLNNALLFNIYRQAEKRNSLTKKINNLFSKLSLNSKTPKSKSKTKDALRQIILNLFISYLGETPIEYSRNRDKYLYTARYGRFYFKYKIVIPLIDKLESLGYLEQKIGFFNKDKGRGKETRMWPTEKLIKCLNVSFNDRIVKEQPCEIIQLKNKEKIRIDYTETQNTDRMRKRLERYNNFISKQNIILKLENETFDIEFLHTLWNWVVSGMCDILELTNFLKNNSNLNIQYPISNYMSNLHMSNLHMSNLHMSNLHMSNLNTNNIPLLSQKYNNSYNIHIFSLWKNELNDELNKQKNIALFKLDKLFIKLNHMFLHRVFNNGKFSLGGRFYGAVHQQLPSAYRRHIFINDNPTIELDYSALHIRMLYHREGIDFRNDPYEGIEERNKFKTVQLILINAEDRKEAVRGIRKELMEMGYRTGLKDKDIEKLIETFVSLHPTISKFLHSGIGLKLQNIDAKIMDNILTNLTNMGIPALPVHDSVIVEKGYEKELKYQMVNCYKKIMNGFEPIIH